MTRFALEPLYGSIGLAIGLIVVIVVILVVVTPPTDDVRKRKWLILLRSLAAMVLLIAAMRPAIVRTDNRPAPATLVIAIDSSRSMSLPDGGSADRWSTQIATVKKLLAQVGVLDDAIDVQLIRYDKQSESIGRAAERQSIAALAGVFESLQPIGDETDLGRALQGCIEAAAGRPLAGVVLFGDGTQTISNTVDQPSYDQVAAALRSAEVLDALGVPLWTVPIGPPGTDASARDVAVTNLPDSYALFAGNQFDVSVAIQATGLANRSIPIRVTWIAADGSETVVMTRQVDARSARESMALTLPVTAPEPGLYRLRVSAEIQDGEWVTTNNSQIAFADVREGGGRILMLEGPGRPEQTFLRRSLRRFPDLVIDHAPIRGDRNWPINLDAALQPGRYDIFVIGDLDSGAIGDVQLKLIADRVAAGAGLITLGGFQTYGIGGYADGPLATVLPVVMDASQRRQPTRGALSLAERAIRMETQLPGPIKIQITSRHPITDLGGQNPQSVWDNLPALSGANRWPGAKVAAGVQTLLQSPDEHPLLVVGGYGQGRVASLAIDESHRWWRLGQAEAHQRFWRQLMLWLMSREETSGDRLVAEMDIRRFDSDQRPEFRARLQSVSESPQGVSLSAGLVDAEGVETMLEVTAASGQTPTISGRIPSLQPGFYRLAIRASDESIQSDEIAFQVTQTSRELERPLADPVYMQQLAELTSSHGGASFDPLQIDALIETIADKRRSAETPVIEKQALGDGPLSGWIVFGLFTAAISAEWFFRRRWGMA